MIEIVNTAYRKKSVDEPVLESIPISRIKANPYQPRKHFSEESIAELASSIRQVGLLQPINVRMTSQGRFELIAGERRLRACKALNMTYISALVSTGVGEKDSAAIALIENLQRENLHFFEEAEGYQSLIREHGLTQDELARRLSKNQSTIANKLRILRLPRSVKEKVLKAGLSERHARAILRLHDEKSQLAVAEKVAEEGLSVKATEDLVEAELGHIYGEEKPVQIFKVKCASMLYVNTLRKCVAKMNTLGANASFGYKEAAEYLEVTVKIKK